MVRGAAGILRAILTVEESEHTYGGGKPRRIAAMALALVAALALTACGSEPRQDAGAAEGTWKVTVLDWKFPERQALGTPQDFVLKVRNDDTRKIPQLIVTIGGLRTFVKQPGAAIRVRPIWLTREVDFADITPYNSPLQQSFNLGPLEPGATKTYSVVLAPLRRGEHEVTYSLAPDLFGDNKIVNADDETPAKDSRIIAIDPTPEFDRELFED